MTIIHITTKINALKQTVFDVSRNIEIHQQSASPSKETAIAGSNFWIDKFKRNSNLAWQTFRILSDAQKPNYRNDIL